MADASAWQDWPVTVTADEGSKPGVSPECRWVVEYGNSTLLRTRPGGPSSRPLRCQNAALALSGSVAGPVTCAFKLSKSGSALGIPLYLPCLSWPAKGHCRASPKSQSNRFELIGRGRRGR